MEFRLGDVLTLRYGKNQKKVKNPNGKYPILGTGGVMDYADEYLYDKPSILIGRKGSIDKIRFIDEPFWTIDTLFYSEINEDIADPKYLYYKLSEIDFNFYNEGTTIPSLRTVTLNEIKIKLPSLETQRTVAYYLNNIDYKIELNLKIIANLEELSQTLFKRWFVDFEFPDEEGNPYKSSGGVMKQEGDNSIPINWDIKSLETIMEITSGKRPKSKKDTKEENYTIPIIGASQTMGYTDAYLFDSRILVMGRVGTHGVIQRYITKCWPSDNTLVMHSIYYNFLYEFLNTVDYKSLNRGSTQPLLTQSDIKKLKLPLPNKFEKMDRFELELDPLLNMIFSLKIENNKLTKLRDTLLPKLMSGEIELPDELEVDEYDELLQ